MLKYLEQLPASEITRMLKALPMPSRRWLFAGRQHWGRRQGLGWHWLRVRVRQLIRLRVRELRVRVITSTLIIPGTFSPKDVFPGTLFPR